MTTMMRPMFRRAFSTTPRPNLARMQVIGRLGAEPELVATSTGKELVRYVVASSYGPSDDRKTSWFRVASFAEGGARDFLLSLQKGTLIHLDADARMSSYDDAEGQKKSNLSLVQRSIEILARPKGASAESEDAVPEKAGASA
ncbi:single-strand binding protein family [Microthyrium microscopicum]|uniref:Single-stranded DNA-binding protein n=1 Tax=Microthyrium microscopicum TaxID=703497 RepID=A0A6A6UDI1_9PEZI|nr:single-strand binding protein family [Microthyrium microscopicum]